MGVSTASLGVVCTLDRPSRSPGQLPLLNFPEISMWGQNPWGRYGANSLPGCLQRLWNQTQHKLAFRE